MGRILRYLTAGESHGKGLVGILDGLPSQVLLNMDNLKKEMSRRKWGLGRGDRQRIETDEFEIVSGVRFNKTTGNPISVFIANKDYENWKEKLENDDPNARVRCPRPGHADAVGALKYSHSDIRNVIERASARETAVRVLLGGICKEFLSALGINIASHVIGIGGLESAGAVDLTLGDLQSLSDLSPVRCVDERASKGMMEAILTAKNDGNTLGGKFEVLAEGVPLGLGGFSQWDRRLGGILAQQLMGLNAIKAVEVGLGAEFARRPGSQSHDEFVLGGPKKVTNTSNRSGGISGGMATGQRIVLRAIMKPLSTLGKPLRSVNLESFQEELAHVERSDVCAVPSAAVIAESLVALALTDEVLTMFGGDSFGEIHQRVKKWNESNVIQ